MGVLRAICHSTAPDSALKTLTKPLLPTKAKRPAVTCAVSGLETGLHWAVQDLAMTHLAWKSASAVGAGLSGVLEHAPKTNKDSSSAKRPQIRSPR